MEYKQIRVKKDTWDALTKLGQKGESYDDIIRRYLPKNAFEDVGDK